MAIDHQLIPLYCLIVSLWITFMTQFWKRRQAEIASIWNLTDYKGQDTIRDDFESDLIIHKVTKELKSKSFVHSFIRAVFFNIPMVLFGLAMIIAAFVGFRIWSNISNSFTNGIVVGAVNGASIAILNKVYLVLSWVITDLENHKYESEWENSYITKIYSLQFVNCYISLFAIAFYDAVLDELAYQLVSIFIVNQLISSATEIILPWVLNWYHMRNLNKKLDNMSDLPYEERERERCLELNREYIKSKDDLILYQYLEMVTQIGYLTMFSSALPITSLLAFINNEFDINSLE